MKYLLICTAALALGVPATSFADSVKVSYRDLDLSTPGDAVLMLHRLEAAATEACGADRTSLREYRLTVERSTCHRTSMDKAVTALGAPAVTTIYEDRVQAANNN